PRTLSGGQIQRLVIAAALSAGARTLVLDEPVAMLDPLGARTLLKTLRRLADDGVAVLLVEHRLPLCWPVADRLIVMDRGRIVDRADLTKVGPGHPVLGTLRRLGLRVPGVLDLADRRGIKVAEVEAKLTRFAALGPVHEPIAPATHGEVLAQIQVPSFRYPGASRDALVEVELTLLAGERVALLGANGAGKSTLLGLLSGALRCRALRPVEDLVAVPQDPDLALFCRTVAEELAYGPSERRDPSIAAQVKAAAQALSVSELLDRAPQALSRGQRLRVAVAAALSCDPRLLVLDEPTSGQDHQQVESMLSSLALALREGVLIFATHDVDLALRHATRVLLLDQGRVIADGPPAAVLASLPRHIPLVLPTLSRLCLSLGIPPSTAAQLAAGMLAADQLAADQQVTP
ncbi:MAG: ATP-binding cassette domain-containing protein, partial [Oligoflexia bacterium]|nr:ATP-binding cassette domain-containing protein [Oligoflexia bacterium]